VGANYNKSDQYCAEAKYCISTSGKQPEGELTAFTRIVIWTAEGGVRLSKGDVKPSYNAIRPATILLNIE
jgi:hypothetical protein